MIEATHDTEREADARLIERYRAGDQRAATQLVERHAVALARFARSLGEHHAVDELVQDTFVRAFGALDAFRGESSLRTWLFTIERRLVVDRRRDRARERARVGAGYGERPEPELTVGNTALDEVVAEETEARLRLAVDRLTPTQREVFVLRVGEGRSYKEIAEIAGTTEGAARVHYHNAMRAVKEFLDA
jgi:RNA polymerase sigma-70 factor (ECF subfamily)